MEKKEILDRIQKTDKWVRLLYMLLYLVILWFVKIIFLGVIIFQFLSLLFTEKTNANLLKFSKSLSSYAYQVYLFLTYNTEEKSFPFGDWPKP